jgi:membrane associated rhomboid family serine protease
MYLPAIVVLGLWFLYQILLSGAEAPEGGGIAFFAHIGGFIAGMILVWIFRRPRDQRERRISSTWE